MRSLAEMENVRTRTTREVENAKKFGSQVWWHRGGGRGGGPASSGDGECTDRAMKVLKRRRLPTRELKQAGACYSRAPPSDMGLTCIQGVEDILSPS